MIYRERGILTNEVRTLKTKRGGMKEVGAGEGEGVELGQVHKKKN